MVSCCLISTLANGQTTQPSGRVVEGLQALYLFDTGSGNSIYDKSGSASPIDLTISDTDSVRWDKSGLRLFAPTVVKAQSSAARLTRAIIGTNEVTLEAWVTPANFSQSGPARIVSLSNGVSNRNLTLGQVDHGTEAGSILDIRLRTTFSGGNGLRPPTLGALSLTDDAMMHILFSRNQSGMTSFYVNGVKIEESSSLGDLSNWDESFTLLLGNELSQDRPWLGTLHLVALYNRALTEAEVAKNFVSSPGPIQTSAITSAERSIETSAASFPAETTTSETVVILPALSDSNSSVGSDSWPAGSNGDLPLGGVFYGNPITGISTGNAHISVESSRRFRAERTGMVSSVRFQNRVLSDDNIQSRCRSGAPGNRWCTCVDNNLDSYSCGYTLGNSYSVGNGGTISVELRPDDGMGQPADIVLGRTGSYVPKEDSPNGNISLDFSTAVPVEAGRIYHLVHTNSNPPSSCSLSGMSPAEAKTCPRNQGAIGLNGVHNTSTPTSTGKFGPYRGSLGTANLGRNSGSGDWKTLPFSSSYYELTYDDGVSIGDTYQAHDALGTGRRDIGGSVLARQRFDVQDANREVDGIWLNFGHTTSSDGRPLNVSLKDSSGNTLATASIPASDHCMALVRNTSSVDKHCRDWGYSSLSSPISLIEGSSYHVEFSSSSTRNFVLSGLRGVFGGGFNNRNEWTRSAAQLSTDSGRSWKPWAEGIPGDSERDLPLLFTISGMPRSLD